MALAAAGLATAGCFNSAPAAPQAARSATAADTSVTYPKIEASFRLDGVVAGNPFDFEQNDVRVTLARPGGLGEIKVPAFFDGDGVWRVRHTPRAPGAYRVAAVTHNGKAVKPAAPTPERWDVSASAARPGTGFVRRDPKNAARFVLDGGAAYYPVGHNVAWEGAGLDVPGHFAKMGAAGENWSRVWMNHWDAKNLDWVMNRTVELGTLDLEVARKWDGIVEAAERHGIRFQMTLQHHGQYSSTVNPNWGENPWNAANAGGFLKTPEEFFTSERAKKLTRAKYRYIVARWGHSPAVMAWELFNEVQFTDTGRKRDHATIAAWHREMAGFLRAQDPDAHLVTTSSDLDIAGLYDAMDYVQPHAYPPDVVAAAQGAKPSEWKKPIFFGEIGAAGDLSADKGETAHAVLWGSLVSESSGAAQYWAWDTVEKNDLWPQFAAATAFVRATNFAEVSSGMRPVEVAVATEGQGSVSFGPGMGWGQATATVFPISLAGTVQNVGGMPGYLQGTGSPSNHKMFPYAEFPVEVAAPATFTVTFNQSAKAGAHPVLKVDGRIVAEIDFPAAERETPRSGAAATLTASVPAGKHVVRLENTGADWAVIGRITVAPYGPTLRPLAKAGPGGALIWLRNAQADGKPVAAGASVTLPAGSLAAGTWRAVWWDTYAGKPLSEQAVTVAADKPLTVKAPAVEKDVALAVIR